MTFTSPFGPSAISSPGTGEVVLSLLQGSKPALTTLSYQYPLKLVAPTPSTTRSRPNHDPDQDNTITPIPSQTIYLLSYGGGLVSGDTISLSITLGPHTRLTLLTQGSTKIFKAPSPTSPLTTQTLNVKLGTGAGLCYLPDPCQPFRDSGFEQRQVFELVDWNRENSSGERGGKGGICVLDWVSEGRSARGEKWDFHRWVGRNEVYASSNSHSPKRKLLLRDAILLDAAEHNGEGIKAKTAGLGVLGTLILHGELFARLAAFFMDEFGALERIGGRNWGGSGVQSKDEETEVMEEGPERKKKELLGRIRAQAKADGVIWTAARVRESFPTSSASGTLPSGFVLVKFGAVSVEGARRWIGGMLRVDGSVEKEFGEEALLGLPR